MTYPYPPTSTGSQGSSGRVLPLLRCRKHPLVKQERRRKAEMLLHRLFLCSSGGKYIQTAAVLVHFVGSGVQQRFDPHKAHVSAKKRTRATYTNTTACTDYAVASVYSVNRKNEKTSMVCYVGAWHTNPRPKKAVHTTHQSRTKTHEKNRTPFLQYLPRPTTTKASFHRQN